MKIKFPFTKHVFKLVVTFLISVIVVPFTLSFFVNLKTKIKEEDRLHVFITATIKEEKGDELINKVFNNVSDNILECKIFTFDIEHNELYYSPYEEDSDLIILNKGILGTNTSLFHVLPNKYINTDTYLESYGMKIYDNATKTGYLTDYINYIEDDYYLFINKNSKHISSLNNSSINDDALTMIENILG